MNHRLDITPSQKRLLSNLLEQHLPDVTIWAHGSRIKGTAQRHSDLDLVVFAPQEMRAKVAELDEILDESDLPFLVDLLIWDDLPQKMRRTIEQQHLIIQQAAQSTL